MATVTTKAALQFPASELCSSRVSLLLRYGMRIAPLLASADTTDESASSDMLMALASCRRAATLDAPSGGLFLLDSMPARSTSVRRPCGWPSGVLTSTQMMPWPRLDTTRPLSQPSRHCSLRSGQHIQIALWCVLR